MFSSAGGQLTSNIITGIKNGEFSISKAFKQIDKADLIGSSIGSTIGMTLGSMIPIPVVGTVLGGIVGGFLGSKVAKWVSGLFGKKKNATDSDSTINSGAIAKSAEVSNVDYSSGVAISETVNSSNVTAAKSAVVSSEVESVSTSTKKSNDSAKKKMLKEVQDKYFEAYGRYNQKIQENDIEGSKEVFKEWKEKYGI